MDVETCDRCGARAVYRYQHGTARLTMCGHHGRQHGHTMRALGWFTYRIVDLAALPA